MKGKNTLLLMILVLASIASMVFVYFLYQHSQKIESEFNEEKAGLIQERLDLEDRIESIQEIIDQKTETLAVLEKQKKTIENELGVLKEETKRQIEAYSEELEILKAENATLDKRLAALEKKPLLQRMKESLQKERDEDVKEILKKALANIDLVHSGGSIELEPIVVGSKTKQQVSESVPFFQPKETVKNVGKIHSFDKTYKLVVINLGRRDQIRGSERCLILKEGKEIAKGEVISIRYRISAVFIDEITEGYTFDNMDETCEVLVLE